MPQDHIFPVSLDKMESSDVSRGDYYGDTGLDINMNRSTPILAVGDGVLIYATWGHVDPKWRQAPNTAYSAKIKLAKPVLRSGKVYPYVYYTHMESVVSRSPGDRINQGDVLGYSGFARTNHLHITFYEGPDGGPWLGGYGGDDETMLWDEWLVDQYAERYPEPEEEEMSVTYAYQSGKRLKAHEINGLVSDHNNGKQVWANFRGRASALPKIVIRLRPEVGRTIELDPIQMEGENPQSYQLSNKIEGVFTADFRGTEGFTLSVKQYE